MVARTVLRSAAGLAGAAAILMALFPPWTHTALLPPLERAAEAVKSPEGEKSKEGAENKGESKQRELRVASRYAWIGSPPHPPRDWPVPPQTYWSVGLDTQRLTLQYALLAALCAWIWLLSWAEDDGQER